MTPQEYIQLCSTSSLSPVAQRSLKSLLLPFRLIDYQDRWEREIKGSRPYQRVIARGSFGPKSNVILEMSIAVSGIATCTATSFLKGHESPSVETFTINPQDEMDLAGWTAVALSTIAKHCRCKSDTGGYFVGVLED